MQVQYSLLDMAWLLRNLILHRHSYGQSNFIGTWLLSDDDEWSFARDVAKSSTVLQSYTLEFQSKISIFIFSYIYINPRVLHEHSALES